MSNQRWRSAYFSCAINANCVESYRCTTFSTFSKMADVNVNSNIQTKVKIMALNIKYYDIIRKKPVGMARYNKLTLKDFYNKK